MKKQSILQVTNRLPWPLNDGGNLATYAIAKHLSELGHSVTLASLNTQKHWQDPKLLSPVAEVHAVDIDTSLKPIPMLRGLFQSLPYNIARFQSAEFESLITRLVREKKPDVVQMEGSYQALFIPAVRKVGRIPIVLRSHNIEWRIWKRLWENESNPAKRFYLKDLWKKIKGFEEETGAEFDGIVAITEEDEKWYRGMKFPGKITTINAGADLSRYQAGNGWAPAHKVGFIGSMEWEPNVQGMKWFLERIWPEVHRAAPTAEFHIAGKNPAPWMEKWNEVPGVTFHGMVDDAVEFMKSVRVFIVPLLSGSGMRLKIVEALAMKKCVLSTSIGAEGIVVQPEKEIFLADEPRAFGDRLLDLLRHPEKGRTAAERGHEAIVKRYDWNLLIRRYLEFYQALS